MNIDDLRDARPSERDLPASAHARIRSALLEVAARDAQPDPSTNGHRWSGRTAAGIIAAVLLIGGGAAAAVGFAIDRDQAQRVADDFASEADIHLDGWRPPLDAENVTCTESSSGVWSETYASDFRLHEPLTEEALIAECRTGSDMGFSQEDTPAVACSRGSAYPELLVVIGGNHCPNDAARLTETTLRRVNELRAVEVAVLTAAESQCPTFNQAVTAAESVFAQFNETIAIRSFDDPRPGCWRAVLRWHERLAIPLRIGNQPGD